MYEKTKMQNIIHIKQMKWRWAGHIMRLTDERWTKKITEWWSINKTRSRRRPARRWSDDLKLAAGIEWSRIARDRDAWSHLGEAYALGGLPSSSILLINIVYIKNRNGV